MSGEHPLRATIVPVTPLQQNCTLLWCTKTMRGAFVDPGGDLPRLRAAMEQHGVTIEKILITHGHLDHCAEAGPFAESLGVPIEGPHEADRFLIEGLAEQGARWGLAGTPFEPDRWLDEGDTVSVGELRFDVRFTPGHTPGHIIFYNMESSLAIVGDVLFQGSVGRTDLPGGNHQVLLQTIADKLWTLPEQTAFIPGHGPISTFEHERKTNPFVSDAALAR